MPPYLLPRPGLSPELLEAALRDCGLVPVGPESTRPRRFSDGATPSASEVEYVEDAALGQRRITTRGPRAEELRQLCAAQGPCWTLQEALDSAAQAMTLADKVATLGALVALGQDDAASEPQVHGILRTRLTDAAPPVQQAAVFAIGHLLPGSRKALLQALAGESQLDAALRRQLAVLAAEAPARPEDHFDIDDPAALQQRAELALREHDAPLAQRLLGRALELSPLASAAYLGRAQASAADGRPWSAMIDVTMALAIARRQGVPLQAMQELQSSLRAQLITAATPPTAAVELQAVGQLALLLRHGRLHEVEEIADTLLALPGRAPLWWLAIGLSRWERGRHERALEALETALTGEPDLLAARFLRGQCFQSLGDIDAALGDFAVLDPVAGQRPAKPSLLTAYADELLGTQAPWEAREHAFARVQLLRGRGRRNEALAVLTELLRREPPAADALLAQGILFAELAQPAAALLALDQALTALRPEERMLADEDPLARVQLHRAELLVTLGDPGAAAAAWRTAQRLGAEHIDLPAGALPPADPSAPAAAAAYAKLRGIAQQALLQDDSGEPKAAATPPGALDATVARVALREQLAELFVAALGALDTQAGSDACRALLQRSWRALNALGQLAPQVVTAQAVRPVVEAVAGTLGLTAAAAGLT